MEIMVDPPEGWKYGFPKEYNKEKDGEMREWLVKEGYPRERILAYGEYFYVRFISKQ